MKDAVATQHHPIPLSSVSPQLIINVNNDTFGELGYIVIDRPVLGRAFGPIVTSTDVTLTELISLARILTYKWSFLNVPMGGAMGGISADLQHFDGDRAALMERFGQAIAPLVAQQVYYPGADSGTRVDDLGAIMRGAGQPLGDQQVDSAFYTALTVFETIQQVANFKGIQLTNLRVALEGFGKVGSVLAKLLDQVGAKLVALSTSRGGLVAEEGLDVSQLLSLKQQYGGQLVSHYANAHSIAREALFCQPVDLLVPGARPYVIHANNVNLVQAKWIVPVANAPITSEAEQMLTARGIVVVPDFVANCGGVLAVDMHSVGFNDENIHLMIKETFAKAVTTLLQIATHEDRLIGEIARTVAWQNHCSLNNEAADISSNYFDQMSHLLRSKNWDGMWRRLAWRIHCRWPYLNKKLNHLAVERFAEWRLGATLRRIGAFGNNLVNHEKS